MKGPLNLASRPLRNERLPALLFGLAAAALLGVTVKHVLLVREVLPGRASKVDREVVVLEQEIRSLREEASRLGAARQAPPALKEWTALRELVDRRAFSWTALFGSLEEVLPPGIRLVSIAPEPRAGSIALDITAVGRSVEDGLALLRALQQRGEFADVFLSSVGDGSDGAEFSYTMSYVPSAGTMPEASP